MSANKIKKKKPIPFEFVFYLLDEVQPYTKPMFGCTAVYVGDKIVLVLREKDKEAQDNGVWIATTQDHHESLRKLFSNMRSISSLGKGVTGWQILPADADDFEESVNTACELILSNDQRIGKIPKRRL